MSVALCLAMAPGCVTVNEEGEIVQEGLPDQPDGLAVGTIVQLVQTAVDTDADGWIDAIPVSIYFFASDRRMAIPIWIDGSLSFTLTGDTGVELASWDFTQEQTASMRAILGEVGRGYGVILRLKDDEQPDIKAARAGSLGCVFTPVEGDVVATRRPTTVIIGATGWAGPGR